MKLERSLRNLKLGFAVRSLLVPFKGRAHQVVEAGVPEIGHDVVAPPKCVQLILLHGGLNLEDIDPVTHAYKNVTDNTIKSKTNPSSVFASKLHTLTKSQRVSKDMKKVTYKITKFVCNP